MLLVAAKDLCPRSLGSLDTVDGCDALVRLEDMLLQLFARPQDRPSSVTPLRMCESSRWCNFTHFTRGYRKAQFYNRTALDRSDLTRAWVRQEAAMCATNSEDVDSYFPTYSGALDALLDAKHLGFVVAQVNTRACRGGATPFPPMLVAGDLSFERRTAGNAVPRSEQTDEPTLSGLRCSLGSSVPGVTCSAHQGRTEYDCPWWQLRASGVSAQTHPVLAQCPLRSLAARTPADCEDRTEDYLAQLREAIEKNHVLRA